MNDNNNNEEFDENGFDPTKEAFFSDLESMEDDIANEAYDLVEHAISLIASRYYDDSIEVMRQAIGMYAQIGRDAEIDALNQKISEVYILKEQDFTEIEAPEKTAESQEMSHLEAAPKQEYVYTPEQIIEEANQLIEIEEFDEALERYREAYATFQTLNKESELEELMKLIEICYQKKARFEQGEEPLPLPPQKKVVSEEFPDVDEAEIKAQRLREFEETKKREEDISNKAYDLMEKGYNNHKDRQYDEALQNYDKASTLFAEINWTNEIQKTQVTIIRIREEKKQFLEQMEAKKVKRQQMIEVREKMAQAEAETKEWEEEQVAKEKEDQAKELERKKIEDKSFEEQINERVNAAEREEREYEKAIKKGKFELECPYLEIIEIYEEIKEMLVQKGWTDQTPIYTRQILLLHNKLEKDKKLREIEALKAQKQKEYDEIYKMGAKGKKVALDSEKLKEIEVESKLQSEQNRFITDLSVMAEDAERMAREYEVAIKKGKFETVCPYSEIIEIYEDIRNAFLELDMKDQAAIYLTQVRNYHEKLDKDNRLREVEAQKAQKQKEYDEIYKTKTETVIDPEKFQALETQYQKEQDEENFRLEIEKLMNDAEKMARAYEIAIRKGKFENECVYPDIIAIFERIVKSVEEKGWATEVAIYKTQIRKYEEKLAKDLKIRQIEDQKKAKQQEYDNMLKVQREEEKKGIAVKQLISAADQEQKDDVKGFESYIAKLVHKAEMMTREYELAIRKGKFDQECVYPEIIEFYVEIRRKLLEKGWKNQAAIYTSQIKAYQDKFERDKKLREIEAKKKEKQEAFKDFQKVGVEDTSLKAKQLLEKEEKERKEKELVDQAFKKIDDAEKLVKNYELKIKKDVLLFDSPYEDAISLYKESRKILQECGWKDEAFRLISTIKFYKEKLEKDNKLREIEKQKIESAKTSTFVGAGLERDISDREHKIYGFEKKKREEEEASEEIFSMINEAETISKDYEQTLKGGGILHYDSPYDRIITIYREAKKRFDALGWTDEANKLINSINFYKAKQEKDIKLREIEKGKGEKDAALKEAMKAGVKDGTAREKKILEIETKKKEEDDKTTEALNLIDKAEALAKEYEIEIKQGNFPECPYEDIIKMYRSARQIFEDVGWKDQSSNLIGSINHYKEKLEKDKKLRALEAEKIEKQKLEAKIKTIAPGEVKEKERELLKQKREALLAKQREQSEQEQKRNEAFNLMDKAKTQFTQNNFDDAIDLYTKSKNLFSEIDWKEGINMVVQSITLIKKKKAEFEKRQQAVIAKEAEKVELEKQLEERLLKVEDKKKEELEKKRKELLKLQSQKTIEMEVSEQAFKLLEEGTKFLEEKNFTEAHEKYTGARDLFKEINWHHEVSRINNELLFNLKKEEKNAGRLKAHIEKKKAKELELEALLKQAEEEKSKAEESEREDKRKRLAKLKGTEKLKKKIMGDWEKANSLIDAFRYNEAVLNLKSIREMMERAGWKDEIVKLNKQIQTMKKESEVPLITDEELDKEEDMEKYKVAYLSLDKANTSISRSLFMKAVSELNEAKFNLKDTKIGSHFIDKIDEKIVSSREALKTKKTAKRVPEKKGEEKPKDVEISGDSAYEYMDKMNKEERKNNYEGAIKYANTASEIFQKLGPEWSRELATIKKHILTLKTKHEARRKLFERAQLERQQEADSLKKEDEEAEELKKRLEARRAERRKKIESMKKDLKKE